MLSPASQVKQMRKIIVDSMHPTLRELYQLWEAIGWHEKVPKWEEVCRANLKKWMPQMVVIQARDGQNYIYRYYGPKLKEEFGRDLTGKAISELPEDIMPAEQRSLIEFEYKAAQAKREPLWRSYTAEFDGELRTWQRLVLPASTDGEMVDMIVIAACESRKK